MQFRLISWASDLQPIFGIMLGLVGLAMIAGDQLRKRAAAVKVQPAGPSTPPCPGQQFPTQQYPGQQYPAQQYPAQQYPAQQHPAQQYPALPYPPTAG